MTPNKPMHATCETHARDGRRVRHMKVVDSVPQFWYLLRDAEGLILTVSCEHSFVGYDFTMRLSTEEVEGYHRLGSSYLSNLAEAINFSCPIAKGSASPFKARNVDAQFSNAICRAVEQWKAGN